MPTLQTLSNQRNRLIAQIAELGAMRPGSICQQKVKYRAKDGAEKENGPYPILTYKAENNKTRTIRMRSDEQTEMVQNQIDTFREFQRLTKELVQIGRQMADLEMFAEEDGKKNSSRPSRLKRKGKPRRSSSD
jgi:hypothetical protein